MNATRRIVLVLGAGASKPYGFPLGAELLAQVLSVPTSIMDAVMRAGHAEADIEKFKQALARSGVDSIDQFLACRPDHHECGKAVLAFVLSTYERHEDLFCPGPGRWYSYLANRFLFSGQPVVVREKPELTVITFNYDRSFDYWLLGSLAERTQQKVMQCQEDLKRIKVIHLHGTLGGSPLTDSVCRPYGSVENAAAIRSCVEGIRVIHEQDPQSVEWKEARQALLMASQVVFLGFGYEAVNLQRLEIAAKCHDRERRDISAYHRLAGFGVPPNAQVLGTRMGIRESELGTFILPELCNQGHG